MKSNTRPTKRSRTAELVTEASQAPPKRSSSYSHSSQSDSQQLPLLAALAGEKLSKSSPSPRDRRTPPLSSPSDSDHGSESSSSSGSSDDSLPSTAEPPLGLLLRSLAASFDQPPQSAAAWQQRLQEQSLLSPHAVAALRKEQLQAMGIPHEVATALRAECKRLASAGPPVPHLLDFWGGHSQGFFGAQGLPLGDDGRPFPMPLPPNPSCCLVDLAPAPEKHQDLVPAVTPEAMRPGRFLRHDLAVPFISVMGDCAEGKSFIVNHLGLLYAQNSPHYAPEHNPFSVSDLFQPVTAGINVYYSSNFSGLPAELPVVGLLDYEASNNSLLPCSISHNFNGREVPSPVARRKAVARYFPQLASLISDAIVVVTSGKYGWFLQHFQSIFFFIAFIYSHTNFLFSSTLFLFSSLQSDSTFAKLCDIAAANAFDIEDGLRPALVLIQNRVVCSYGPVWDIDNITSEFLEVHDPAGQLRNMFSDVMVLRLPDLSDRYQKVFHMVLTELRQRLVKSFLERKASLSRYFRTITHPMWHNLLNASAAAISKRKRPGQYGGQPPHLPNSFRILDCFSQTEDSIANHVILYWNALLLPPHSYSLAHFIACRRFAFLTMARIYSTAITEGRMLDLEDSDKIRAHLERTVHRLWNLIDSRAPCQARPSTSMRLNPTHPEAHYCGRSRFSHFQSGHRTRGRVHMSESELQSPGVFSHFSKHRFLNDGIYFEWSGPFVSGISDKTKHSSSSSSSSSSSLSSSSKLSESETNDRTSSVRSTLEYVQQQLYTLAMNSSARPEPAEELIMSLETQGVTFFNINPNEFPADVACLACFRTPSSQPAWTIPAPPPVQLDYLPLCDKCLTQFRLVLATARKSSLGKAV